MKRLILILLIISLFNNNIKAQETKDPTYPRFTFGLEWGYVASLHSAYHYNFFAQEGYRVDDKDSDFIYKSNADVYLNLGWDLNPIWNLSLYIGYAGIADQHNSIPITIRGTRYFGSDALSDRWFAFADIGSGICLKTPLQEIATAKIGAGYQLCLSPDTKLSFLLSMRTTYSHPNIYYDYQRVPMERTNRNDILVSGLSVGLALLF